MEKFAWQQMTNPAVAGRNADPDGDNASNFHEYEAGTDPLDPKSVLRINSIRLDGNDVTVEWSTAGGRTNVVQAAPRLESLNFQDLSPPIAMPGEGNAVTNFRHTGGGSNPASYYRVRLWP